MNENKSWARIVGEVFNTLPRNGVDKETFWMPRKQLEEKLLQELEAPGVHVCIDGPTGTGKTSLAKTVLMKNRIPHRLIQITMNMTWVDFCFTIIKEPITNNKNSFSANIEFGVNRGLPSALFKLAVGKEDNNLDDRELKKHIGESITEDVICELMATHDVTLFIDDFERASKELVERISDMCKLLTESHISRNAKLVIVGTDDIYTRLTLANKSLEDRVYELSVGSFTEAGESWKFILNGLSILEIKNPATYYKENKKGFVSYDQLKECQNSVYEAVDGLPKGLNKLGRAIALIARPTHRTVSVNDILSECKKVPAQNIRKAGNKFPGLKKIASDPIISKVLRQMYKVGINRIHRVYDIIGSVEEFCPEEEVLMALDKLRETDFITITGTHNDILFVTDPTFAHTLGVINTFPGKYDVPRTFQVNNGPFQLSLPFL